MGRTLQEKISTLLNIYFFHSWRFCLADEEIKQNDLLQDGF